MKKDFYSEKYGCPQFLQRGWSSRKVSLLSISPTHNIVQAPEASTLGLLGMVEHYQERMEASRYLNITGWLEAKNSVSGIGNKVLTRMEQYMTYRRRGKWNLDK